MTQVTFSGLNRKEGIMKVAIIMGSTSDLSKVEPAITILKDYGVEVTFVVYQHIELI